ncbi:GNAT family N-acetyltransferase [Virgibacillus necropolis]|uniref:GNAT family N-acetyltransferase n=1 Tax=Virgibacillus necropolis TaxID=163877 RepID=UPI00384E9B64
MAYKFAKMNQQEAENIAYNWHYAGEYAFYDIQADEEDFNEFIDPEQRGDKIFVVMEEDEIVGFFSFNQTSPTTIDIGLGMRPNLTGNGNGLAFLEAGLAFARSEFNPEIFTLSVATFNQRAINVYKNAGFVEIEIFMQKTNGGNYEFVKMKKKVSPYDR